MKHRTIASILLATLALTGLAQAAEPKIFNEKGVAILGYDPIAYFEDGKPLKGDAQFHFDWNGATWLFASAAHRDLFAGDPERYAPQYGGYCAYAVSQGSTASIDPQAWTLVGDKLYLNYSKRIEAKWLKDRDNYIAAADKNWPGVLE